MSGISFKLNEGLDVSVAASSGVSTVVWSINRNQKRKGPRWLQRVLYLRLGGLQHLQMEIEIPYFHDSMCTRGYQKMRHGYFGY